MYVIPEWHRLQSREEEDIRRYLFREDQEARANAEVVLPNRLPKRWRKNTTTCPVTGKETHNATGIHESVLKLAQDGIKYRTWHSEHVLVPVAFGLDWLEAETVIGGKKSIKYVSSFDFLKHVSGLVNQPRVNMYPGQIRQLDDPVIIGTILEHSNSSFDVIWMSREQAQALIEMIALFNKFTTSVVEDAEYRANHWLTAMASGRVTLDQIDGSKKE